MKKQIITLMALLALACSTQMGFAASKKDFTGVLNINTASVEELTQLSGIGRSKAEAIVNYRQAHPFKAVSELSEVKGIGPKMLEKLQSHLTIDGNTSSIVQKPLAASNTTAVPGK